MNKGVDMRHAKIFAAEFIGTLILTVIGLSSLYGSGQGLDVGLTIGFAVIVASLVAGPVSGAHINPLVTIALAVVRKVDHDKILTYLAAQFLGGLGGGLLIFWIARGRDGGFSPDDRNFQIAGWESVSGYDWVSMAILVMFGVAVLSLAYVAMASRGVTGPSRGVGAGLTYAVVTAAMLGVVGVAMNPALSFGTSVFAGGDAFKDVWLLMVFGVVGAAVGVMMFLAIDEGSLEDTMLGEYALVRKARDVADSAVDRTAGAAATAASAVGSAAEAAVDTASDAVESVSDKIKGDDDSDQDD